LIDLLTPQSYELVVLIKPQFEAGRQNVGKGGVVRDFDAHVEVLEKVVRSSLALRPLTFDLTHSPVKGPNGNIEYLLYLKEGGANLQSDWASSKVEEAFSILGAP